LLGLFEKELDFGVLGLELGGEILIDGLMLLLFLLKNGF
jgi:hypothetical protein